MNAETEHIVLIRMTHEGFYNKQNKNVRSEYWFDRHPNAPLLIHKDVAMNCTVDTRNSQFIKAKVARIKY
jgi:hypothetical protein